MARTKASVGAKISAGKSSKARCNVAPPPSSTNTASSGDRSSRQHSGGNPVCPRETPKWQRPITNFFISKDTPSDSAEDCANGDDTEIAGTSKSKTRRIAIESDEEEEVSPPKTGESEEEEVDISPPKNGELDKSASPPKNRELDESLVLEPLNGDDSHKIEEYYPQNTKGKGRGKKSKNKENIDGNVRRNSVKRDLEEVTFGEETEHASKKVKVA